MKKCIPDNPEELSSTTKPTLIKLSPTISKKKELKINERIFFEVLTKKERKVKKESVNGIFKTLEIFSFVPLQERSKKYYKFPFTHEIKYEDNILFHLIYKEYQKALIGAYNNLNNKNIPFYLIYNKELIFFSYKTLVPLKFKNLLISNELIFKEDGKFYILEGKEVALFFDVIINTKLNGTHFIPFILSTESFENSIGFSTRWIEEPPVKSKDKIKYHYKIIGYLISDDFKDISVHDVHFTL